MDLAHVFDDIYRRGLWRGRTTRSGPGSDPPATTALRELLPALIRSLGVRTVLDIGCGEGSWMPDMPAGVTYTGMDVSKEAIRSARERHPDRTYVVGQYHGETAGLTIIRDVLQHLPVETAAALVDHVADANPGGWLLASTYAVDPQPDDIEAGDCATWNLALPPFALGPTQDLIADGYRYDVPGVVRDATKYLGLWRLG